MTPPLFLVADLSGDEIELTGAEAHHAAVVRRMQPGEVVLLADGMGAVVQGEVSDVAREILRVTVLSRWIEPSRQPRLVLVQALPKGERAELAVEILTELGVDEIMPWAAARSVSVWHGERAVKGAAKWRRTAWEASKQSRRARVPVVAELASTAMVTARLGAGCGVVLHESASEPVSGVTLALTGDVIVVVGPEGGVTEDELAQFTATGAVACRLGPEVMRTSTAGAAALAVLSVKAGRWA